MLAPGPETPFDTGEPGPTTREAVSDVRGRFDVTFEGGAWPSGLRITCPGRAPFLSVLPWRVGEIRVGRSVRVRGRVVEQGTDRPVVGALVRERPDRSPLGGWNWVRPTKSDAHGAFELEVVGPRGLDLEAVGIGENRSSVDVVVEDRDVDGIVLALDPPGARGLLEGRVLVDDRPVAGVRVALPVTGLRTERVSSAPTGADGIFRCEPAFETDRAVDVDATAIGLGTCRVPVTVGLLDGRASCDLALPSRWTISGSVVRRGTAVAGAKVCVESLPNDATRATTDESVRFRLEGVFERGRRYVVWATAPDGGEGRAPPAPVEDDPETKGVVIEVAPIGHVRGRVLAGSGRPVEGAEVWLGTSTRTDASGRFDLRASPGRHKVLAMAPGFLPTDPVEVEVPEGEAGATCDLSLRAGGRVSGRVFDADGRDVDGVAIRIDRPDRRGSFVAVEVTGDLFFLFPRSGRFLTDDLEGESFRLTISAPGFVPRVVDDVRPGADLPAIVLEHEPATPTPR